MMHAWLIAGSNNLRFIVSFQAGWKQPQLKMADNSEENSSSSCKLVLIVILFSLLVGLFSATVFRSIKQYCPSVSVDKSYSGYACDEEYSPTNHTNKHCSDTPTFNSTTNGTECIPVCTISTTTGNIQAFSRHIAENDLIYIKLNLVGIDTNDAGTYLNVTKSVIDPYTWTWAKGDRGQTLLSLPPHIFVGLSLWTLQPQVLSQFEIDVHIDFCPEFVSACDECKMRLVVEFLYNFTVNAINFDSSNSDLDISDTDICQDRVPNTIHTVLAPYFGFEHIMIYSTDTVCWEKLSPSEDVQPHEYTKSDWVSVYVWVVSGVIGLVLPLTAAWFVPKYKVVNHKLKKSSNLQVGFLYTVLDWGSEEELYPIQLFRFLFVYIPVAIFILYPGIIVFNEFDDRESTAKYMQAFIDAGHINCKLHIIFRIFPLFILAAFVLQRTHFYYENKHETSSISMAPTYLEEKWPLLSCSLFEPQGSQGGQPIAMPPSKEGSQGGQPCTMPPSAEGSQDGQPTATPPSTEGTQGGQPTATSQSAEGSQDGQPTATPPRTEGFQGGQPTAVPPSAEGSQDGQPTATPPSKEGSQGGQSTTTSQSAEDSQGVQPTAMYPIAEGSQGDQPTAVPPSTEGSQGGQPCTMPPSAEGSQDGQPTATPPSTKGTQGGQPTATSQSAEGSQDSQPTATPPSTEGFQGGQPTATPPNAKGSQDGQPTATPPSTEGFQGGQPTAMPPSAEGSQDGQPTATPPSTEGTQGGQPTATSQSAEGSQDGQPTATPPSTEGFQGGQPTATPPNAEGSQDGQPSAMPPSTEGSQGGQPTTTSQSAEGSQDSQPTAMPPSAEGSQDGQPTAMPPNAGGSPNGQATATPPGAEGSRSDSSALAEHVKQQFLAVLDLSKLANPYRQLSDNFKECVCCFWLKFVSFLFCLFFYYVVWLPLTYVLSTPLVNILKKQVFNLFRKDKQTSWFKTIFMVFPFGCLKFIGVFIVLMRYLSFIVLVSENDHSLFYWIDS